MQVIIVGSGGQLGSELRRATWPAGMDVLALSEAELDITDEQATKRALQRADLVINAAAYTAVDKAESDEALAFRVNRDGPSNLAKGCASKDAPLLHVSTDYVFDGSKIGAYLEDDTVAPLGVYGASKAAGETAVRNENQKHVIVRTSWVVSAFGQNFVKTMLRLASERDQLRVVADQLGRPTPAKDLAGVLIHIARRYQEGSPIPWSTYHFAAAGCTSWHGLATEVVELQSRHTGRRPTVEPIATEDYPTPARRPKNSELDTRKLEAALEFQIAPWQIGLADVVDELLAKQD
jgi:dTDP-4-dehydrorhamnose reductase